MCDEARLTEICIHNRGKYLSVWIIFLVKHKRVFISLHHNKVSSFSLELNDL